MRNDEDKGMLISPHFSLSSFEMGRDDVNVLCTYGKISIWLGRQVPDLIVGLILIGISKIDNSATHEIEMVCDLDEITEYESKGYVLVSYARIKQGYRTTFNVPFSSKNALYALATDISKGLKNEDTIVDCYWTGDDQDIMLLYEEFKGIKGWKVKGINYKDDAKERCNDY